MGFWDNLNSDNQNKNGANNSSPVINPNYPKITPALPETNTKRIITDNQVSTPAQPTYQVTPQEANTPFWDSMGGTVKKIWGIAKDFGSIEPDDVATFSAVQKEAQNMGKDQTQSEQIAQEFVNNRTGLIYGADPKKLGLSLPDYSKLYATANEKMVTAVGMGFDSGVKTIGENIGSKVTQAFNPEKYVQEQVMKREAARAADSLGFLGRVSNFFKDAKTKIVDSNAPIEDILWKAQKESKFTLLPEDDITNQIDRSLRAPTIAGQFVKDNGLEDIIRKVDDIDNLDQYLIAKHAKTLEANKIKTGRDLAKDQTLIEAFGAQYEPYAKTVKEYSQKLLDYAVEAGLVAKEVAQDLKVKYPDYVPMNRVFSELEQSGGKYGSKGVASLSKQTVVQKIKGSEREVESPLESLMAKTYDAFKQGEKNKTGRILASYEKLPGNPFQLTPLRTAKNVKARIDVFKELKESKPVKNKLDRLLTTRRRWVREIQSQLNKLNKEGISEYLKRKPVKETPKKATLEKKSIFTRGSVTTDTGDKFIVKAKTGENFKLNPVSVTKMETRDLVNSLIAEQPDKIKAIRSKMATRDKRLASVLDDLYALSKELDSVKLKRVELFDEAKLLKDAESRGKSTISVFNDGIKEIYETSPEIAQAAKLLNAQQMNILGKMFALPVRIAKLGITGINLPFLIPNIGKDQLTAIINSNNALKTSLANPKVYWKALLSAVKHDDIYQEMVRAGGGGTSFDIARNQAPKTIEKIRSSRSVFAKAKYFVKNPGELLRAVEDIVSRSEEFTRLQQYAGTKEAMLEKGLNEKNAIAEAARATRENTVNFARRGEWGTVLNSAFLYLNANIQGTRTFLRNMARRPVATSTKLALTVFTPMAVITAYNLSDPERKKAYEDIAEFEKKNNLIIIPPNPTQDKNGKWNVIKIPISQEVNNISSIPRRFVEQAFKSDSVKGGEIANALLGTVSPIEPTKNSMLSTLTPQAIKPTIESAANYNFFTGLPIVSDSKKGLSPELQVRDNTSGTARKIGGVLDVSPLKVESFIRETFGGVGSQVLNLSDQALAKAGVIPKEQIGGQNVAEAIFARFGKATGGEADRKTIDDIQKIITSQNDERFKLKQEAENLYSELKKLPGAEANKKAEEVKASNPQLYEKLKTVFEENKLGLNQKEKFINQLGVDNGEKAKYIWEQINTLKTPEEKNRYVNDLRKKKIISDKVLSQLIKLKSSSNQ